MREALRSVRQFARRRAGFVGSVVEVRPEPGMIVLTYDDGPEPGGTEPVLDALAKHHATATFFVLLTRVRRYGSLLEEIVAAGHEIALHGIDHRRLTDFSPVEVHRRTADGRAELEDTTGRPVTWMRPPYGRQTLFTYLAIRRSGLVPVLWGPTTWDSYDIPQHARVSKAQEGARSGAILLAHDGFASEMDGAHDGPAPAVDRGELSDRVLQEYGLRGLSGHSLGDALRSGTAVREARFPT
ncbi:MAG: hypothetical protein DLM58_22270 [Pseudonocardiales bacterium]|nr:MAG: hypothetical protein DLM58_22270 [Pseudonocardiales bacterium]